MWERIKDKWHVWQYDFFYEKLGGLYVCFFIYTAIVLSIGVLVGRHVG